MCALGHYLFITAQQLPERFEYADKGNFCQNVKKQTFSLFLFQYSTNFVSFCLLF